MRFKPVTHIKLVGVTPWGRPYETSIKNNTQRITTTQNVVNTSTLIAAPYKPHI